MRYRHGDLVIDQVDSIPADAQPIDGKALAQGSATGHSHIFVGSGQVLQGPSGQYLRIVEPGRVVHEEHGPLDLSPGAYRVTKKRQHSPDGWTEVQD